MNDSTTFLQALPDTLKNVIVSTSSILPTELIGLIGVALGALIAILGNWMLAKRQAYLQIQNSLFLRRLDVYLKLTELLWPAGIKQYNRNSTVETSVPMPYTSNKNLSKWLNDLTIFVAANRLIIDDNALKGYEKLSQKVIEDLKHIAKTSTPENIDKTTRVVGLQSASIIINLCTEIHNSGWNYFHKNYKVKL